MLNQKIADVYNAFVYLNQTMYQKYKVDKDKGYMYIPKCKTYNDLHVWVNYVLNNNTAKNIKVANYYNRIGFYKLNNLYYWEAIILLNLILQDDNLQDCNFKLGCDANDELHREMGLKLYKNHYGTIIILHKQDLIIITVKKGRMDVDIEFLTTGLS